MCDLNQLSKSVSAADSVSRNALFVTNHDCKFGRLLLQTTPFPELLGGVTTREPLLCTIPKHLPNSSDNNVFWRLPEMIESHY